MVTEREPKYNYLVGKWQGLLQQLVYFVSRGYYFYHVEILPAKKREKWPRIDEKLISKYMTRKSKYQRARARKKGLANFYYLRYEDIAVILHTKGEIDKNIVYDDVFSDVRKKPMVITISDLTEFIVKAPQGEKGATVEMSPRMVEGLKSVLADMIRSRNIPLLEKEFDRLNGLPATRGIIAQKYKLIKFIIKQAKMHQLMLHPKKFRINTFRKIYPVWIQLNEEKAGLA